MILTGEQVDAATALRIGLVEDVCETGASLDAALSMAERVKKQSPDGVASGKVLIHQARLGVPRHAALALEREKFVSLFDGADQIEGVRGFLEKRAPRWSTEIAE
jgi:enoyl-CoA hydratase/carnithine racemase